MHMRYVILNSDIGRVSIAKSGVGLKIEYRMAEDGGYVFFRTLIKVYSMRLSFPLFLARYNCCK